MRNYTIDRSLGSKLVGYGAFALFLLVVSVLAFPVMSGIGRTLDVGNVNNIYAQAELSRAREREYVGAAQLADAKAVEFEGRALYEQARADSIRALEGTVASLGPATFQVGIALLIVLAGSGALWVLFNFGLYLSVRGITNEIAEYKYHTAQIPILTSRPLLPGGNIPVIAPPGAAARRLSAAGYRVATDINPMADGGLVDAERPDSGARPPGGHGTGNTGERKFRGRGRSEAPV